MHGKWSDNPFPQFQSSKAPTIDSIFTGHELNLFLLAVVAGFSNDFYSFHAIFDI